jgi:hypothetical protein
MPLHHCPSIPLLPPSTTTTVNKDHHHCGRHRPPLPSTMTHHCCRWQQTMTAGFWRPLLSTVWQQQWKSLTAAIAVVVDGGGSEIEPTALMAAFSTVAAVDGGGNDGVFTDTSHDNDRHPCLHRPCPSSDKDQMARWRARCDTSHSLLPWSLLLVPSLSPLMVRRHQGRQPRQHTRP